MKKSKILLASSALLLALGLASCGEETKQPTVEKTQQGETKPVDVKVWCAENIVNLTTKQLEDFKTANPDIKVNFTVEAQGEGDAASNMVTDVEAGADIFCFPQDQLARLISAGALAEIGGNAKTNVQSANDSGSVAAASVNDSLYAYPITSDNGYFMYYNKDYVKEESIDDMTKLIADVKEDNKFFAFQLAADGAWYNAGFFFAVGCESTWTTNDDGKFTAYNDTYNSDKGLVAVKGMSELINSGSWVNSSTVAEFDADAAIVVSGTWDYATAKEKLGDKLGVADLPSFTVDGKSYHLGSFGGYKLMGVKPQIDSNKGSICHKVAQYLSSEKCQTERFNAVAWGPSNVNAQNTDAVKANPALVALAQQSAYAIPQGQYPGDWWTLAAAIGSTIQTAGTSADLTQILKDYAAGLDALLSK